MHGILVLIMISIEGVARQYPNEVIEYTVDFNSAYTLSKYKATTEIWTCGTGRQTECL